MVSLGVAAENEDLDFLKTIVEPTAVSELIEEHRVGVTRSGDVIFFQLDQFGRCRAASPGCIFIPCYFASLAPIQTVTF